MNREIKFKLVIEGKHPILITEPYTIDELFNTNEDEFWEGISQAYGDKYGECDGNCTNESVNHCECGSVFEGSKITHKLQYIERHDKNNKELFEGDLIKHNKNIFLVKWSDNQLGWVLRTLKEDEMNWRDGAWAYNTRKHIEKIGSIHDNPELLNDKK